jgi:hypothetical protein
VKRRLVLGVALAGVAVSASGCNGGPGQLVFTKEKAAQMLKIGSALVDYNAVYAFVDCKLTCDALVHGSPNFDKLEAACPGNWRYVRVGFSGPPKTTELIEIPAGSYDKTKAIKFQADVSTKDNSGRLYNYSTAKPFHTDIAYSGKVATVNLDVGDSDSSLKGTIKAEVCPKK